MTESALRRLIVAGKLEHEKIAGKYFVTLSAIEDMRAACRVPATVPGPTAKTQIDSESPRAVAAMNACAAAALENLRPRSSAVDAALAIARQLKHELRPNRDRRSKAHIARSDVDGFDVYGVAPTHRHKPKISTHDQ